MDYIDEIYYSAQGLLTEEAAVPWVENVFAPGSPCDTQYHRAMSAYARLRQRLGAADEDADVESLLDAMLCIQRELGRAMFLCGVNYGRGEQQR